MNLSSRLLSRTLNPLAMLFLFLSGAAGLIYEIVWARYLALFLGHTSYAVIMVLAAFMGGLAIGSYWLGKRSDQTKRPLKLYAVLELGIGVYGLIFPWYYAACRAGFAAMAVSLQPGDAGRMTLQLAFSALTIFLPTLFMGGTLPVMAKSLARSLPEVRGKVAALYAINSAGAVLGCILADFWLIPDRGLSATVYWAAALNFVAGFGVLALDRWWISAEKSSPAAPGQVERFTPDELKLAVIAIGASGFVAMLYEVVWTRLLALAVGSSTHAFSIMLTTFITGIAAGAWLLSRWRMQARTMVVFAWVELAVAASVFASLFAYSYLPYWFAAAGELLARREEAYPLYECIQATACFGVAFVPTLFLGMTLPLASRILTQDLSGAGTSVGRIFATNTLGTVFGAVITGVFLMPWLGLARTLAFGAAVNATIGLALLGGKGLRRGYLIGCLGLAATVGLIAFSGEWFDAWPQRLIQGLWRKTDLPASLERFREASERIDLRYYRDGAGSTVSVSAFSRHLGGSNLFLCINGKPDAGTAGDNVTQSMLGHLPMLLHPNGQEVLVVGLGSGMTCGAIATHPSLHRMDVVEISPEVAEASREFSAVNGNVLADPRLHLTLEDAKSFLQTTPRSYDVIVSEPSNPWVAGVAGLFSREYYESCRAKLNRGGIMTQWVQLYESSDEAFDIVLRTFTSVFPNTRVWYVPGEAILTGTVERSDVNLDSLEARLNVPAVQADLGRIDLQNMMLLLTGEIFSQENCAFVTEPEGPLHSDGFPVLEYVEQRAFFARETPTRWMMFDETGRPRPATLLGRYLKSHEPTIGDVRAFVRSYSKQGFPSARIVRSLIARFLKIHPESTEAQDLLNGLPSIASAADAELRRMSGMRGAILSAAATDPRPLLRYRDLLWQDYSAKLSAFYTPPSIELLAALNRLLETDSLNQRVYKLELARIAWDEHRDVDCMRLALNAIDPAAGGNMNFDLNTEAVSEGVVRMAELLWRLGNTQMALRVISSASAAEDENPRISMFRRKLSGSSPIDKGTFGP